MMARSGEDARDDRGLGGPDVCRVHARKRSVTRLGLVEQQAASLRRARDETVTALQRLEQSILDRAFLGGVDGSLAKMPRCSELRRFGVSTDVGGC